MRISQEPTTEQVYLRAGIRLAAEKQLRAELAAVRARAILHEKIFQAYGRIATREIVQVSGLTRQRIHQIVKERKNG